MNDRELVAVVIPCYRVRDQICEVIEAIPDCVGMIVAVDDCCPDNSGALIVEKIKDKRLSVLHLASNQGVGGAVLHGMWYAHQKGAEILIKLDGDGQHDPKLIPYLIAPIKEHIADYVKGNRFYQLDHLLSMPLSRKLGNAGLSFATKLSSGYWSVMDPTNGFFALPTRIFEQLPIKKLNRRYLFESDMLFRMGTLRAKVMQIPMKSKYEGSISGFRAKSMIWPMLKWHTTSTFKRYFYTYLLRSFSIASMYFPVGFLLLGSGILYGVYTWILYASIESNAPVGTIVFIALLIIVGLNSVMNFFSIDMASEPREPTHMYLPAAETEHLADYFSDYSILLDALSTNSPAGRAAQIDGNDELKGKLK